MICKIFERIIEFPINRVVAPLYRKMYKTNESFAEKGAYLSVISSSIRATMQVA